jgi:hypothetical protein
MFDVELPDADLTGGQFYRCPLPGSNFRRSKLNGLRFYDVDLRACDFSNALVGNTSFGLTSLFDVSGLSGVVHDGPSGVDMHTLLETARDGGLDGEVKTFLTASGVPPEVTEQVRQLAGSVTYNSCFISYGQPDLEFAKKLLEDLRKHGVSCWLYDMDATPGRHTWREISARRAEADKMLVLCSAPALVRDGVLREVEQQLDEESDKIVPVSIDDLWLEPGFSITRGNHDLKTSLTELNRVDIVRLGYEEGLLRLLNALRRSGQNTKIP